MFNSSVLEVAIGLVFIYLLLSLICTSINEAIASSINKRGTNLFEGIKNLLNDPDFTGLAQNLYNHGLVSSSVQGTTARTGRLPSYLSSNVFALALMDILGSRGAAENLPADLPIELKQRCDALISAGQSLAASPADPGLKAAMEQSRMDLVAAESDPANQRWKAALTAYRLHLEASTLAVRLRVAKDLSDPILPEASKALGNALAAGRLLVEGGSGALRNIKDGVAGLAPGHTRESLLVLIDKTQCEIQRDENLVVALRQNVEQWFDDAMDRVGGWYKRWTQISVYVLGFVVVCATNADTINIVQQFGKEDAMRAALITAAEDAAKLPAPDPKQGGPDARNKQIERQAEALALPLGWSIDPASPQHYLWIFTGEFCWLPALHAVFFKSIGLAISIFAVSLGAPFWFDTLSKFINLRGAGTPPGDTKKSSARAVSASRA